MLLSPVRGRLFHASPIRKDEIRHVVPENSDPSLSQSGRAQCRRAARFGQFAGFVVVALRGIDLGLESEDLFDLRSTQ